MDYLNERKMVVKEEPQQSMVDCDMHNKPKGDKGPRKDDRT